MRLNLSCHNYHPGISNNAALVSSLLLYSYCCKSRCHWLQLLVGKAGEPASSLYTYACMHISGICMTFSHYTMNDISAQHCHPARSSPSRPMWTVYIALCCQCVHMLHSSTHCPSSGHSAQYTSSAWPSTNLQQQYNQGHANPDGHCSLGLIVHAAGGVCMLAHARCSMF